ncbi:MAG: hypothetical protein EOO38_22140, partial [Cytophagaceae bacterium]
MRYATIATGAVQVGNIGGLAESGGLTILGNAANYPAKVDAITKIVEFKKLLLKPAIIMAHNSGLALMAGFPELRLCPVFLRDLGEIVIESFPDEILVWLFFIDENTQFLSKLDEAEQRLTCPTEESRKILDLIEYNDSLFELRKPKTRAMTAPVKIVPGSFHARTDIVPQQIIVPFFKELDASKKVYTAEVSALYVQQITTTMAVHKFFPFGLDLHDSSSSELFSKGMRVQVSVNIDGQRTQFEAVVTEPSFVEDGRRLLCLRIQHSDSAPLQGPEQRSFTRWSCGPFAEPHGTALNPAVFAHQIWLSVRDISVGGMLIRTNMQNYMLDVGTMLECSISLPSVGSIQISLLIKNRTATRELGKEYCLW